MASSKVTSASSKTPAPVPSTKVNAAPVPVSLRVQQENSKDEAQQSRTMDGTLPSSKVVPPVANASSTPNATPSKDHKAPTTTKVSALSSVQDLAKFIPAVPAPKAPIPTSLFVKPKDSPTNSPIATRSSSWDDGDSDLDYDPFSVSSPDVVLSSKTSTIPPPTSAPQPPPHAGSMPPPPPRDPLVPAVLVSFSSSSSFAQTDPNNNNNNSFSFSTFDIPSANSSSASSSSAASSSRVPFTLSDKAKRVFNKMAFDPFPDPKAPKGNPLADFPPITPNGSRADLEELIDVVLDIQRFCMILARLANTVTTDDINQKSVILTGIVPQDVILNPSSFEAYVYYLTEEEWKKASKAPWGFAAVDDRNAENPLEDPNIRYTIYYSSDCNNFPGIHPRAGDAFQLQRNATICGVDPSKNAKLVGVHFLTADDFRAASEKGREGSKVVIPAKPLFDDFPHVLTPIFALAFIKNDDRFVKLHCAGIPPKASEKKVICLMRAEAAKWGFNKDDVIIFGIQRNKFTAAPTSYGFATVLGDDLARQFVYNPLHAKTSTIVFNVARDRKPNNNQ